MDIVRGMTSPSLFGSNPGETANVLLGSSNGKPKHLDTATLRCVMAVIDSVTYGETSNSYASLASSASPLFVPGVQLHLACLIKRTSLYDVQGVFCLWDWVDTLLEQLTTLGWPVASIVDLEFVVLVVRRILAEADHAVALMRTLSFCYGNFGLLMSSTSLRTLLVEETLLQEEIFTKLFLSWSCTIRAYFLHLLVFRLAHIADFPVPQDDAAQTSATRVANLFHQRLNGVRTRYEQLLSYPSSGKEGGDPDRGHTSCSHSRSGSSSRSRSRSLSIHSAIRTIVTDSSRPGPATSSRVTSAPTMGLPGVDFTDAWYSDDSCKFASPVGTSLGNTPIGTPTSTPSTPIGTPSLSSSTLGKAERILGINSPQTLASWSGGLAATAHQTQPQPVETPSKRRWFRGLSSKRKNRSDTVSSRGTSGESLIARREARFAKRMSFTSAFTAPSSLHLPPSSSPTVSGPVEGETATPSRKSIGEQREHISPHASFDLQSSDRTAVIEDRGGSPHCVSAEAGSERPSVRPVRVSREFTRQSSLVPGPARELVTLDTGSVQGSYARALQPYAMASLREYEQTVEVRFCLMS